MKSRKVIAAVVFVLICGPLLVVYILFRSPTLTHVSLCLPHATTSALPVLADKLGYFNQEGLEVDLEVDALGKTCIEGLIARQFDFAVANVAPAVDAIVMANPLLVISELHSSAHQAGLVFHHKYDSMGEYTGKTVAVVSGTDGEMTIRLYVREHANLKQTDIKMVKVHSYREAAELLEQGKVHAAVLHEPMLSEFVHGFSENEYRVDESAFYTAFGLLLSHSELSLAHPETIDKLIRSLAKAQKFTEKKGAQAREIVLDALQLEDSDAQRAFWSKIHFSIGLSSVMLAMMNQAELTFATMHDFAPAETSNINIYQSLYPQTLRKLNTELVTYE